MMQRIQQFFRALTAQMTAEDYFFVNSYLTVNEQPLFMGMSLPDQYHALHVAYTVQGLLKVHPKANAILLTRCALLHDIGKRRGDMSILGKVFAVLLHKFLPTLSKNWAHYERKSWRDNLSHLLFVYYHHAAIGAQKLQQIGCTREAAIIVQHHQAQTPKDSLELNLLRLADSMN